jgi:hypothetical protein
MGVVYTSCVAAGLMDLPRFVEVTSTAAARFLNIYPRYTHPPFFFYWWTLTATERLFSSSRFFIN